MTDRYQELFKTLKARKEKAFIPFFMLADPTPEIFTHCVETAIMQGADALELGIGFSDPVADGPVIEKAHQRAIAYGGGLETAFRTLKQLRQKYPKIPIGILTYASMVFGYGVEVFIRKMAEIGVDSVLVADCPLRESKPLLAATNNTTVAPIFIAPPGASEELITNFSKLENGYIYLVSRPGVTGVDKTENNSRFEIEQRRQLITKLHQQTQIPIIQGFGIAQPNQVKTALETGVDGVICGSAIVQKVADFVDAIENINKSSPAYLKQLENLKSGIGKLVSLLKTATREER